MGEGLGTGRCASWLPKDPVRMERSMPGPAERPVKDRKKEIGKGLLHKMLTDLGIDRDDF